MDIRAGAATYYDRQPIPYDDIRFYKEHIPSPDANLLELGCGTGRVLLSLVEHCGYIHGLDLSAAMLAICREKITEMDLRPDKVGIQVADITNFDLGRKFDLVIAPYRVFQNLESDAQVDGFFRCVRQHLAVGGTCILNVFRPKGDPDAIVQRMSTVEERLDWKMPTEDGQLACYEGIHKPPARDAHKLIIYPRLIYRRYGEGVLDEAILDIAMRVYYPSEFEHVIVNHGFKIINRWGGYAGEPYGEGGELVIEFAEVQR